MAPLCSPGAERKEAFVRSTFTHAQGRKGDSLCGKRDVRTPEKPMVLASLSLGLKKPKEKFKVQLSMFEIVG